jgi:heme-degrading monooxygenase HmoA
MKKEDAMFVRVTSFEIDVVRMDIAMALERFKELVLPELRKQPGFKGLQVLTTDEGGGLLLSFWDTERAADAGIESGYYMEQIEKFVMFMKQPPGREHYRLIFSEGVAVPA